MGVALARAEDTDTARANARLAAGRVRRGRPDLGRSHDDGRADRRCSPGCSAKRAVLAGDGRCAWPAQRVAQGSLGDVDDEHLVGGSYRIARLCQEHRAQRPSLRELSGHLCAERLQGHRCRHRADAVSARFLDMGAALQAMVGDRFKIHGVFVIRAKEVHPIVAPSYVFYPADTTEEAQAVGAADLYGVSRRDG
uniref:hypothetical protein n=2 Tax=Thauera sp. SDU_THAU2 TaxID=3136633 RepID=UPI00311F59B9